MTEIPDYIEQRIRRPIPSDSCVVPGSTPVVAFGNARTATVATLGINPSRQEFLDTRGNELAGCNRRLATHRSLGTDGLSDAPLPVIAQVLHDCDSYFQRNPYFQWFDQLEKILQACESSYYDGSACHLDLVQWATDPTWNGIKPRSLREQLIDEDKEFLNSQLTRENIGLLLVNGDGVVKQLRRKLGVALEEADQIENLWLHPVRLLVGKMFGRIDVVAWSVNIQSSHGVTNELRTELATRVAKLANPTIDSHGSATR